MNARNWVFARLRVFLLAYMFVSMYISHNVHKRCTKETSLKGYDINVNLFSVHKSIPAGTNLISCAFNRHKMRVTNCDKSGIFTVANCDLSQFVINATTWHIVSNNIELKRILGTWESTHVHFWHEHEKFHFCQFWRSKMISLLYLFVCMYISYKAHNRCTKETLLKVSDVDVNMFPAPRSMPSCTTDMNRRSCVLNRHKMQQSQIATNQVSLPSQFVICRNLWSRPRRGILSPITLKTCSGYLGEYPCSLLTWK